MTFPIGKDKPCLITAEISCNHAGDLRRALDLIGLAWANGADAVKFQHFTPAAMASPGATLMDGPWAGRNLRELYAEAETPDHWFPLLFQEAKTLGLIPFSSVVDLAGIEACALLGAPAFKVSSFELTDTVLLRSLVPYGKPVILSTGMASMPEVRDALDALYPLNVCLLHCVSAYPTPLEAANLDRIEELADQFPDCEVGLSWHNTSPVGPITVAQSIRLLEVHLRDDGPDTLDAAFSYRPEEFGRLVRLVREAERLGSVARETVEGSSRKLRRPPGGLRG